MAGRLFSADPIRKRVQRFHYDHQADDGTFSIEDEQDVEDTVEINKGLQNQFRGRWERHGTWGAWVGQIPPVIAAQLIREGIFFDDRALLKWLGRSENEVFQTRPGRYA